MPMAESQNPAADPASAGSPLSVASRRVTSVDALRGFDMFWIIGADVLFYALSEVAGENRLVKGLATQLEHVAWEGFRFYDLIFPMFVFIVGVSLVFSLTRRIAEAGRNTAVLQIFRRAVIIYLLGLFAYDGIAHGFGQIRLLGVLQRIALCYLFAGLAFCYLKPKGLVALCVSLLIGYWALMTFVPVPEIGAGNFEEGKNLANYIDREYLPLRKWDKTHDPEGLLSTLPAIASCLLGVFAGMLLRNRNVAEQRKVNLLLAAGAAGVVLGFLWGMQFPVIKKIWTSSFVLEIGQTVVVKEGVVLAVEGFEGTDKCLLRGGELSGRDGGAVAVKVARLNHDMRFDIPCIGAETVRTCIEARLAVLVIEAHKTILLEREEVESLLARSGLALVTVS